jgi:hypothetical protein
MTSISIVSQSVETAVHKGILWHAAYLVSLFTDGLLGVFGGIGPEKRRLPTGGAAYGILEKL